MNTTTRTTARRAVTTAVLAGAGVLVVAPAFAGVPPADSGTGSAASPTNKAQVEHMEQATPAPQRTAAPQSPSAPYAAQQQAYLDGLRRRGQVTGPEPATRSALLGS